jgi:pSer/pThr/pTyr-binding forkhead associated (FHA) protein
MANWILKFISGKYQGGEFQLEEGVVYGVGRANDSDMVLVEDMVSRNHAKLQVVGDVPTLEDLGSTNGSFVNGERVKKVELKEGDRILFGTSIIRLVRADSAYESSLNVDQAGEDAHTESPTDPHRGVVAAAAQPPTSSAAPARTVAINLNTTLPEDQPFAAGSTLQPNAMPPLPRTANADFTMTPPAEEANSDAPATAAPEPPPAAPAPRAPMQTVARQGGLMTGLLEEISLPDLLQLFSTGRKSGTLRVESDQNATLHIREGRVVFSEIHGLDLHPEKAAYRILTWTTGTFIFEAPVEQDFPVTVDMSTEALMMETFRISDEISHLRDVPDLNQILTVCVPLQPPLRALNAEILDTLQLVINYGRVADVLDRSLANDLETLQDLLYLLQHKYVQPA